jgi:hypothetical protein
MSFLKGGGSAGIRSGRIDFAEPKSVARDQCEKLAWGSVVVRTLAAEAPETAAVAAAERSMIVP